MTRHLVAIIALAATAAVLPGASAADDLARGEQLYDLCQQCHGAEGAGDPMALAPAIAGLDRWYIEIQLKNFKSGIRGTHPEDIAGMRMHPMARWLRTDEDIAAVSAYVASLPREAATPTLTGGNASNGKPIYQNCAACHGADGAGNEGLKAPRLTGASDWYLLTQLQKYKAGIRGSNPANQNSVMMRGMTAMLADEQAMKDVIAHIMSLK